MTCKHEDAGWCYNKAMRNGHNSFACLGEDKCPETRDKGQKRIDIIGSNGNDGEIYLVEKIARAICGEAYADQSMGPKSTVKYRWEIHIAQAMRVLEVIEEDDQLCVVHHQ